MADSIAKQRLQGFLKPTTRAEAPEAAPEPAPAQPTPDARRDPVKPVSVGLRVSEAAELEAIAAGLGVGRSGFMAWVLRRWLADYHAGQVTLPDLESVTTARLPRP